MLECEKNTGNVRYIDGVVYEKVATCSPNGKIKYVKPVIQ